ncbi:hypothetical protein MRX96_016583 [Rhipicephalus microplus]
MVSSSKHDAGNFSNSQAYVMLRAGPPILSLHPAYLLRPLQLKPYSGSSLTPEQCVFNKAMSGVSHYFHLEPPCLEAYLNTR